MDEETRNVLAEMLSLLRVQAGYLADALSQSEALHLHLATAGSLEYSVYISLLEKANSTGGASLLRAQQATIDGMLQKLSGKGQHRIQ